MKTRQLSDIKTLRLERNWSQQELADASGISIRTIQRIESGENADFETRKALGAAFDVEFPDSAPFTEEEEAYVEKLKSLYKLIGIAMVSLIVPIILGMNLDDWQLFLFMTVSWTVVIAIYYFNSHDLISVWKRKVIHKRFR